MTSYEQYSSEFRRDLENNQFIEQNEESDSFFECIQFFKNSRKKKNSKQKVQSSISLTNALLTFQFHSFFNTNQENDYQSWIKRQVADLIKSELFNNGMLLTCLTLFDNNLILSERVFPFLIRTILLLNPNMAKVIGKSFKEIFEIDFNSFNDSKNIADIKRCLKLFICTVDFLRIHSKKIK